MTATFHDVEHIMNEEVLSQFADAADITRETRVRMTQFEAGDRFAVYSFASSIADAIAYEFACRDGDMHRVVPARTPCSKS